MGKPSMKKCMEDGCESPPEKECIWADGRGRAWFCNPHYSKWKTKDKEVVRERAVKSGQVGKKYGEEPPGKKAARQTRAILFEEDGSIYMDVRGSRSGPYKGLLPAVVAMARYLDRRDRLWLLPSGASVELRVLDPEPPPAGVPDDLLADLESAYADGPMYSYAVYKGRRQVETHGWMGREEFDRIPKRAQALLEIARKYRGVHTDYEAEVVFDSNTYRRASTQALLEKWGMTIEESLEGEVLFKAGTGKEARTYSRIAMFDFDGTLFRSWEATPTWWKGTRLDDGPFSFFVKDESLGEPCVPDRPGSTYWISGPLQAARQAIRSADTYTVVITGRVRQHRVRVKELLKQQGLRFDKMYFNPGMSAAKFKVMVLKSLLVGHQLVSQIDIWENENITVYDSALRSTSRALGHPLEIETHAVHVAPVELKCSPEDFGLPSQNSPSGMRMAAETGDGSTVGLFFPVPGELAQQFPRKEKDPSPQHVTLLYIGKVPKAREEELLGLLETAFLGLEGPVKAALTEVDRFQTSQGKAVVSQVRFSQDLGMVRDRIWRDLEEAGFEIADSFKSWKPHSTIAYLEDPHETWQGSPPKGAWEFGEVELWGLGKKHTIPFGERVRLRAPLPPESIQRVARIQALRLAARKD